MYPVIFGIIFQVRTHYRFGNTGSNRLQLLSWQLPRYCKARKKRFSKWFIMTYEKNEHPAHLMATYMIPVSSNDIFKIKFEWAYVTLLITNFLLLTISRIFWMTGSSDLSTPYKHFVSYRSCIIKFLLSLLDCCFCADHEYYLSDHQCTSQKRSYADMKNYKTSSSLTNFRIAHEKNSCFWEQTLYRKKVIF